MHCVGGSISSAVPATTNRTGDGVQLGMAGQETSSESSEADSSECDTTGDDEDGWDSGESSASLVVNHRQHHPLTHSSSRTHVTGNPRLSLKETAKFAVARRQEQ